MAELLLVTAILLLVTALAATSLPVIRNVYYQAIDAANAHALLDNTCIALRNELYLASDVKEEGEDNKAITFIDPTTGYRSKIYLSDENKIYLDEYTDATDLAEGVTKPGAQIIPAETGTDKDMWVEYGTIEFDNDKGMFTVTDLTVKKVRNGQTQTLATQDSLVIRTIHPAG